MCNFLAACKLQATREIQSRVPASLHNLKHFFTLSHTLLLHDSHLNTGLLIAKIQANLARNKANKMVDKIQPYISHRCGGAQGRRWEPVESYRVLWAPRCEHAAQFVGFIESSPHPSQDAVGGFGDFNEIVHLDEKLCWRDRDAKQMKVFRETLTGCELIGLGFVGKRYTW